VPDARIAMPLVSGASTGDSNKARVGAPGGAGLAGQATAVLHELKIIYAAAHATTLPVRSALWMCGLIRLPAEYYAKARAANRRQGVPQDEIGRVEAKLISLGQLQGVPGSMHGAVHLLHPGLGLLDKVGPLEPEHVLKHR
jgi:hypothetical protein